MAADAEAVDVPVPEEGEEGEEAALAEEAIPEGSPVEEDAPELDEDMKAAIAGEAAGAELDEEEEEDATEGAEVAVHLKESVEGSFRMKRLLERADDDEDGPGAKQAKLSPEVTLINKILTKWALQTDLLTKHVLKTLDIEELKSLDISGWQPNKFDQMKMPAELTLRHTNDCRERKGSGGGPLDVVTLFKFRWKLDMTKDKVLRGLCHKDLRYVMNNFDGTKPLDDVVKAAKEYQPEEESTEAALPDGIGVSTIGRFTRLELIDPLADCAVFGDANLTFAMKLAKHRKALGHVGRVIATTFEDLPTLQERYKEIEESITSLEENFAEVYHGVDATRIAVDSRFEGMEGALGAVYYNFPHSGAVGGFFDGHPVVNWRHENLMRLFFRALRTFVKPGGCVKVSSNMNAVGVRYSYIVEGGLSNEFIHAETVPFTEWHLHRYGRSYGDRRDAYKRPDAQNNQSYNAQRADSDMLYCFVYAPSGETLGKQHIRMPPTLNTISTCTDGPFKNLGPDARRNLAVQLRKRFVTEASGTHVG
jgi:hypothetical protein